MIILFLGIWLVGCANQNLNVALSINEVLVENTMKEAYITNTSTPIPETKAPLTATAMMTINPTPTPEPVVQTLPGKEIFTFTDGEVGWYTVDDDVMGLNEQGHPSDASWCASKYRKKFRACIGSGDFNVGILSYNRGGSHPVWIVVFKIPKCVADDHNSIKEAESNARMTAPKHYT